MVFSTIAKMIIGIAVLVLLVLIFFIGPDALFVKLKLITPRLDTHLDDQSLNSNDDLTRPVQDQAQVAFDILTQAIYSLKEDTSVHPACFYFIEHRTLDMIFRDDAGKNDPKYSITIMPYADSYGLFLHRDIKGVDAHIDSAVAVVKIEDVQLCLIDDSNAHFFRSQWIIDEGTNPTTPFSSHSTTLSKRTDIKQWTINVEGETPLDWKTGKDRLDTSKDYSDYVLYKYEDTKGKINICIIPTKSGRSCNFKDTGALVSEGCFRNSNDASKPNLYQTIRNKRYPIWDENKNECVRA